MDLIYILIIVHIGTAYGNIWALFRVWEEEIEKVETCDNMILSSSSRIGNLWLTGNIDWNHLHGGKHDYINYCSTHTIMTVASVVCHRILLGKRVHIELYIDETRNRIWNQILTINKTRECVVSCAVLTIQIEETAQHIVRTDVTLLEMNIFFIFAIMESPVFPRGV